MPTLEVAIASPARHLDVDSSAPPPLTPAAVLANGWQDIAPAPSPLFESETAVVGGKMYVFAGFDNVKIQVTSAYGVYDPAANIWKSLGTAPIPQTHVGTVTDGRYVYFAGGFRGNWIGTVSSDFWKYDTTTNHWTRGPSLPEPRAAGALVLVGRTLHFFGGLDAAGKNDSGSHWSLDLDDPSARWVSRASLPDPRNHLGYAVLNGLVYAIGGQHDLDEENGLDATVDAYDPTTDKWSAVASLPTARSHLHNSTFVYDGKIYCVGGSDPGGVTSRDVLAYDPATNAWTLVGLTPQARSAVVAQAVGDELIVATGTTISGPSHGVSPQPTGWERAMNTLGGPVPDDPGTPAPAPSAVDLAAQVGVETPASAVAGAKGKARVTVANNGSASARGTYTLQLYLSPDADLDTGDVPVANLTRNVRLAPGKSQNTSVGFTFPATLADGSYYVLAQVTPSSDVGDGDATNDVAASASPVTVAAPYVDLAGSMGTVTARGGSLTPGGTGKVSLSVQNLGNVASAGPLSATVMAVPAPPAGNLQTEGSASPVTIGTMATHSLRLAAGRSKRLALRFTVPASLSAGAYLFEVQLTPPSGMVDPDPANNVASTDQPVLVGQTGG